MDISLLFDDATMSGVFSIRGGDLRTDSELRTSVLVSLFSDARALESDQIPDGSSDPRGWCGEVFSKVSIGSRLWLLDRSVLSDEVVRKVKDYISEALSWMVTEKVASRVNVQTERYKNHGVIASIEIYRNNRNVQFELVWKQEFKHGQ